MGLEVFERGTLPQWARLRQRLHAAAIEDLAAAVQAELARPAIRAAIEPGARVALTAGSRGIDRIDQVLAAAVQALRALGAEPFVVPAMGSHGGATATGQLALLAEYGVSEASVGCPIRASMDTVLLGETAGGVPVWFDATAHQAADVIIPIGRVKPHTDFHGPTESGLLKMIAIGLGKQKGADTFHARGFANFHWLIPEVARVALARVNIPFGLALVEDGHSRLALVEAVPAAQIYAREQELLALAREWMPRLPGERIDVLLIDEIGKDISGIGADTNVVNRYYDGPLPFKPTSQRIIARDLSHATEGNATGMGLLDIVLRRLADKIDYEQTYMNCITAKSAEGARLPLVAAHDRQALYLALACCLDTRAEDARIVRIRSTKHIEELWASEPLLPELLAGGRVEQLSSLQPIAFDAQGMLV